jgi:predicted dehydrogenase
MKQLRVAIVGCGWAAGWHATDLAAIPERFSVAACCDVDETRRREFGDRYGIPIRVRELAEILALPQIDVVVLCTPPAVHHPMTLECLAAGKHVVCEKPLTSSLALADSIGEAAARSRGRVMPVFQYRFGNGLAKVRHVIQSGLAGKHFVSAVETARTRGPEYYRTAWRGKFATELGGVLVTQAIHIHDLLCWLVGPVAAVTAFKTTRVNPIEVEDCAVASLLMTDGSLATLTATLGAVRESTKIKLCFENVTFERGSGPDASRPADEPWTVLPRTPALAEAIERKMSEVAPQKSWFARQYELFHEALVSGGPLPVTLDDARASLELITGIYHASETGTVVRLPIGREHPRYLGWWLNAGDDAASPAGERSKA